MALKKLFDESGKLDQILMNRMYFCAYNCRDHKFFRSIYNETNLVPIDFGKNPPKYYNFFKDFENGELFHEFKSISDSAKFKYEAGIQNLDSKLFASSMDKGILPEEIYYNPKKCFSKVEELKIENPNFSEPIDKLKSLYEIYIYLKYMESIDKNSPSNFYRFIIVQIFIQRI
jgi:hypothetical protein